MHDVESVTVSLEFLGSRYHLGQDEIVDLAQQGYAMSAQFGGSRRILNTAQVTAPLVWLCWRRTVWRSSRISSILQLVSGVTVDRALVQEKPSAVRPHDAPI